MTIFDNSILSGTIVRTYSICRVFLPPGNFHCSSLNRVRGIDNYIPVLCRAMTFTTQGADQSMRVIAFL